MTLTIELSSEEELRLAEAANRRGLPADEFVREIVRAQIEITRHYPSTGSELVDYWKREGVIGTRPDLSDSVAHAREIRSRAERRDCAS